MIFSAHFICNVQVEQFRAALGPLTGKAEQYANDACLKRYLRARNWNLKKAEKMMRDSLAWRENYKPEEIRWVRSLNSVEVVFRSLD